MAEDIKPTVKDSVVAHLTSNNQGTVVSVTLLSEKAMPLKTIGNILATYGRNLVNESAVVQNNEPVSETGQKAVEVGSSEPAPQSA